MNAITGFLDTLSSAFIGSTPTGLELVQSTPLTARVAEQLVDSGTTPATVTDIVDAFRAIEGREPFAGEVADTKEFLSSFGWAA